MIAIIAAVAKNGVIGSGGKIPWDIPEDREHFKKLTMGHVVVMGRRTFEEIGHPLQGRTNYVLTSSPKLLGQGVFAASSLQEVIARESHRDIFLCGGAAVYREGMELADFIYLTEIGEEAEGDTYFPTMPKGRFEEYERVYADAAGKKRICYVSFQRK